MKHVWTIVWSEAFRCSTKAFSNSDMLLYYLLWPQTTRERPLDKFLKLFEAKRPRAGRVGLLIFCWLRCFLMVLAVCTETLSCWKRTIGSAIRAPCVSKWFRSSSTQCTLFITLLMKTRLVFPLCPICTGTFWNVPGICFHDHWFSSFIPGYGCFCTFFLCSARRFVDAVPH